MENKLKHLPQLTILLLVLVTISTATGHIIYVNQTTLNPTCCNSSLSNVTCNSFEQALDCVENHWKESVTITLPPGNYILSQNITLQNTSDITIAGEGSPDDVIVTCNDSGAGISFSHSKRIRIENISLSGCGAEHISTSRNFTADEPNNYTDFTFLNYNVALYFEFCMDISISAVNIQNSDGVGLTCMNSNGRNSITGSHFINNRNTNPQMPGGGGVNIDFFTTCAPGDTTYACANASDSLSLYISEAMYEFNHCHFVDNAASSGGFSSTHIPRMYRGEFSFGKGGGLSAYFRGNATNNTISLNDCDFRRNMAEDGGGVFVIFTNSVNNTVSIDSSEFDSNECYDQSVVAAYFATGGAIRVTFAPGSKQNHFLVNDANLHNNTAYYGGGISVYDSAFTFNSDDKSTVEIAGCTFGQNMARMGAALDLFHKPTSPSGQFPTTARVTNCSFSRNGGRFNYSGDSFGRTYGTVNIDHMPVSFEQVITFDTNAGSALSILSATIDILDEANMRFTNCTGRIGGAISLIGSSSCIFVHNNTQLVFQNNMASEKGGAIYVDQSMEYYSAYSYSCFVRYHNTSIHPKDWTSSFHFSNNSVCGTTTSSSIFVHSILPCIWPSSIDSSMDEDIRDTFCWKGWSYEDDNCSNQIHTSAASFQASKEHEELFPGIPHYLDITAFDDLNRTVTEQTLFSASTPLRGTHGESINLQYISDNSITLRNKPNTSTIIQLQTVDTRTVYTNIQVRVLPCPPGYVYNVDQKKCNCGNGFSKSVFCIPGQLRSKILVGHCMSYSRIHGKDMLIVTNCPFSDESKALAPVIILPQRITELDKEFCGQFNRTGILCGECIEGYGISVFSNTFKCIPCEQSYKNWLIFATILFLPLTIFFVLVVLLHIGVTSGPANGFIFFSQVITIPLEVLLIQSGWKLALSGHQSTMAKVLTDLLIYPYNIWSLDFTDMSNINVCLTPSLKVVHVFTLQYASAIYPLLLVGIAYIVIELHARNCRALVCLWSPLCLMCVRLRRNWQGKTSIIDAFATFILLSYSKFIRVSISLLTPTLVYNDNGTVVDRRLNFDPTVTFFQKEHYPYAVLAILVLATFGAIPPLLLLVYPLRSFQKCLDYCHLRSQALRTFVEAFHGCYKDGKDGGPDRRYFAGLYFVFRIIVFTIYLVTYDFYAMFTSLVITYSILVLLVVILQPYKKKLFNVLDAVYFTASAIVTALKMYMYAKLAIEQHLPKVAFYLAYIILLLPMMYMAGYVVYWFVHRSKWFQTHCIPRFQRNTVEEPEYIAVADDERDELVTQTSISGLPDRLENPQRYEGHSDITMAQFSEYDSLRQETFSKRHHGSNTNVPTY